MALYLIVRWDAGRSREVGVNRDGSITTPEHSELFSRADAEKLAPIFRGQAVDVEDYWAQELELDD